MLSEGRRLGRVFVGIDSMNVGVFYWSLGLERVEGRLEFLFEFTVCVWVLVIRDQVK